MCHEIVTNGIELVLPTSHGMQVASVLRVDKSHARNGQFKVCAGEVGFNVLSGYVVSAFVLRRLSL